MFKLNRTIARMFLPQTMYLVGDVDRLYKLFESRAKRKSDDDHVRKSKNPVQMILNVNHEMYDVQDTSIVVTNSFEYLPKGNGFSVRILDPMDLKEKVLTVLKIGKAYIEDCVEKDVITHTVRKVLVRMYLPQTMHYANNNEKLYQLFKNRAEKKSKDKHIENSKNPIQMILNIDGEGYDYQAAPVVIYDSFKPINNHSHEEIGFTIRLRSNLTHRVFVLTVMKIGKAFLEDEIELNAYLAKKEKQK